MTRIARTQAALVRVVLLAVLVGGCTADRTDLPVDPATGAATVPAAPGGAIDAFVEEHGLGRLARARVELRTAGAAGVALRFEVVVADTAETRAQGLMGVDRVPDGVGMLFVLGPPGPTGSPGFWMLDTPVPLDIAFVADGTVVGVATMQPCTARPCPVTHPGVVYDVALEVAAGALVGAGVRAGDRLVWTAR